MGIVFAKFLARKALYVSEEQVVHTPEPGEDAFQAAEKELVGPFVMDRDTGKRETVNNSFRAKFTATSLLVTFVAFGNEFEMEIPLSALVKIPPFLTDPGSFHAIALIAEGTGSTGVLGARGRGLDLIPGTLAFNLRALNDFAPQFVFTVTKNMPGGVPKCVDVSFGMTRDTMDLVCSWLTQLGHYASTEFVPWRTKKFLREFGVSKRNLGWFWDIYPGNIYPKWDREGVPPQVFPFLVTLTIGKKKKEVPEGDGDGDGEGWEEEESEEEEEEGEAETRKFWVFVENDCTMGRVEFSEFDPDTNPDEEEVEGAPMYPPKQTLKRILFPYCPDHVAHGALFDAVERHIFYTNPCGDVYRKKEIRQGSLTLHRVTINNKHPHLASPLYVPPAALVFAFAYYEWTNALEKRVKNHLPIEHNGEGSTITKVFRDMDAGRALQFAGSFINVRTRSNPEGIVLWDRFTDTNDTYQKALFDWAPAAGYIDKLIWLMHPEYHYWKGCIWSPGLSCVDETSILSERLPGLISERPACRRAVFFALNTLLDVALFNCKTDFVRRLLVIGSKLEAVHYDKTWQTRLNPCVWILQGMPVRCDIAQMDAQGLRAMIVDYVRSNFGLEVAGVTQDHSFYPRAIPVELAVQLDFEKFEAHNYESGVPKGDYELLAPGFVLGHASPMHSGGGGVGAAAGAGPVGGDGGGGSSSGSGSVFGSSLSR